MAKLAAMRFKDYVWPHNPRVYGIEYARRVTEAGIPYGDYALQDMGFARRVLRGSGEFVGAGAYEEFKRLASVFYSPGPGTLVHPVWQTAKAYFTALSLRQEPRADYVSYTFEFWEDMGKEKPGLTELAERENGAGTGDAASDSQGGPLWHTVARGETLWAIAGKYGVEPERVIRLNPQLKNPNLILVGERVRVR